MNPPFNPMPDAFHLMVKPTGAACNLACEYCFYLGKNELYRGSRFRMSTRVLETYIQQLLSSQKAPEVCVAWQGGEPTLMGLEFFEQSIKLVRKYGKPGQQVTYTIQTNGIRLNDAWCTFFRQNNFLVGLSLDGPAELHDAYRVNKAGQGSFSKGMRAWDLLQKHGVDTNILCTVNAANASHPLDVYHFFRDELGARFIQFIPVVERSPGRQKTLGSDGTKRSISDMGYPLVSKRSVAPEQFGDFMITIFDEWVQSDIGMMFIQIFDSALASWYGLPANVCVFQETCGLALVLEHNGDLFSCDHFVDREHWLGNIMEKPMDELITAAQHVQFGLDKRDRLPSACRQCDVLFVCRGECPRNRFLASPGAVDGKAVQGNLNYLCSGYRLFYRHIDRPMRVMADLLRQGRAPAEIMQKF